MEGSRAAGAHPRDCTIKSLAAYISRERKLIWSSPIAAPASIIGRPVPEVKAVNDSPGRDPEIRILRVEQFAPLLQLTKGARDIPDVSCNFSSPSSETIISFTHSSRLSACRASERPVERSEIRYVFLFSG